MRRFLNIGIILVLVLCVVGTVIYAQTRSVPTKGSFFNNYGATLKLNKILKHDTTFTWTMTLDTTYYVYQLADTTGSGRNSEGSLGLKAEFPETLSVKPGVGFELKFVTITTSDTDSVFLYGKTMDSPYASRTDSTAGARDTVVLAAAGAFSKYVWYELDSTRMRTANSGSDCVRIHRRSYYAATLADSNATNTLGVLVGTNYSGSVDTVKANAFGYMVTEGDVRVYMSGKNDNIEVGDLLTVGQNGKAVKYLPGKSDTVRTSAAINARYVKGVKVWDIVTLTPIREGTTGGTGVVTKDSISWKYECVTDSIRFIQTTVFDTSGYAATTKTKDSLTYTWTPRGSKDGLDNLRIIGRSLEKCITDSTLKWMRLLKR